LACPICGGPRHHRHRSLRRHLPVHRIALEVARARGLTTHCLEEGYIRPSWITYERHGNNGNSPLMSISLPRMAKALGTVQEPPEETIPATWGDSRQHLWHSALYHMRCLIPSTRYGRLRRHRKKPLVAECAWYVLRALKAPWIRLRRGWQQWWLLRSDKTFHLCLLQLSFDASMQVHSDYPSTAEFAHEVMAGLTARTRRRASPTRSWPSLTRPPTNFLRSEGPASRRLRWAWRCRVHRPTHRRRGWPGRSPAMTL